MRYKRGEKVQRSQDYQNRQCKRAENITLRKEEMYVKTKYQNKTIQLQDHTFN